MGIGVSIFLIAVGALLVFAVEYQLGWLDVTAAGWVLMVVGVVGLLLTMLFWSRRRAAANRVISERRDYEDDPGLPGPPP
jgi:ABC-type transport system involved in cytochrome bd biosynthesis fused ATPase/permease subunit